jgi:S-DNA-T family DNA segregation ATPase FtsK/SpoIIIE
MPEANTRTSKSATAPETPLRWLGYLLIVLSVFPVLSLVSYDSGDVFWIQAPRNDPPANLIGIAGALSTAVAYLLFGFGAWLLPAGMLVFSIRLAAGRNVRPWRWLGWCLLFLVACCGWIQLGDNLLAGVMDRLGIGSNPGGLVGWLLMSCFLEPLISPVGGTLVVLTLMLVSLTMAIGPHAIGEGWRDLRERHRQRVLNRAGQAERLELEERALTRQLERDRKAAEHEARRLAREEARAAREAEREERRLAREAREQAEAEEAVERQRAFEARKEQLRIEREREAGRAEAQRAAAEQARAAVQVEPPAPKTPAAMADDDGMPAAATADHAPDAPTAAPYQLPSVDLLAPLPVGDAVYGDVNRKADTLVKTLSEFNIPVEVTHIVKGPVVTSFELLPAPGIRVERIATMAKNLEMALKATSIRVEAPIPGKGVVGVEMPNEKASPVTVREILEGERWAECTREMELPALLGKNVSGQDLVIDLTSMPHLLVAGATNSGKSVCINAILTGLLMSRTPEQLRLVLVDPKIVEFAPYNELPHLVVPVITDPKKVALGLRWAIHEMEKRYKLLNAAGVRNISAYNRRETIVQPELFGADEAGEPGPAAPSLPARLPYILIVIDELADLMLQAGPEIENGITRLAQLSRAVGIHLLIATQRPSVNVITGTIKANFPGRIAFQVAQRVDSRTILDGMGAETLIGKGDMLFLNPRTSKLVRAQGAYIGDDDAKRVVDYIRGQSRPVYIKEVQDRLAASDDGTADAAPGEAGPGDDGGGDDGDELYEAALDLVRRTRRASTSSLQRAFRIGYTRAARLMDIMEARGIVGPPHGSDPREILIDFDGEIPNNAASPNAVDASSGDAAEEP